VRKCRPTLAVARAILAAPDEKHWGYSLSKACDIRSGVLYPIVHRMLDAGWLADGWEPGQGGRPARRYYRITETGLAALTELVADQAVRS
jgi:PadR family transcriptional regulator